MIGPLSTFFFWYFRATSTVSSCRNILSLQPWLFLYFLFTSLYLRFVFLPFFFMKLSYLGRPPESDFFSSCEKLIFEKKKKKVGKTTTKKKKKKNHMIFSFRTVDSSFFFFFFPDKVIFVFFPT